MFEEGVEIARTEGADEAKIRAMIEQNLRQWELKAFKSLKCQPLKWQGILEFVEKFKQVSEQP